MSAPITLTGTTTSGSPNVTALSSTAYLQPGQAISGTGIPGGATIVSISGASLVLSAAATASGTPTLTVTVVGWVAFTANNIQNALGQTLATGSLQIQPTDGNNLPITARAGGLGGQIVWAPACWPITAGSVGSNRLVPDVSATSPTYISCRITVLDAQGRILSVYKGVQPTGASFNFDTYTPNVPAQAPYVTGPTGPPGPTGPAGPSGGSPFVGQVQNLTTATVPATALNPLTVMANTVIDANHFQFSDGTDLWSAGPAYSADGIFIDDFTLAATANPAKFSAAQILNVITKFMTNLDGSGNIPAAVYQNGSTTIFYSGSDNHHAYVAGDGWASIPLLLQLYYQKTGILTPYTTYVSAVKTAMALIPRNGSNHLLTVVPGNEYVCGTLFQEYMRNTGDSAWGSVCYVRACQAMLALATAAGDSTNETFFNTEVTNVVAGIKSTLIDGTTGMLISATIQNSSNLNVAASVLAVYLGILTGAQNLAIANYINANYSTLVNAAGYILNSPTPWATIGTIPVGGGPTYTSSGYSNTQYQGGYWSYHLAWFCAALSLVNLPQVGVLLNAFLTGPDPATEYYNQGSMTPAGTTPNLESPQAAKLAQDLFPQALTIGTYGALLASTPTTPITITGVGPSRFTHSNTADATIWVKNSASNGSGSVGVLDDSGTSKAGFGYANSLFGLAYLRLKSYFYSGVDMVFTAQVGTGPALTIDAATNSVTIANSLTVQGAVPSWAVTGSGSSSGAFKGKVTASGANEAVIMGELNSVATIGGNNAAFNAWSDLAIQPAGTAKTLIGVFGGNPILKADNNTGITDIAGPLRTNGYGIVSTTTPTTGASCTGYEGQWVFAPDGHIYYGDPSTHVWDQKL
jgi:hypothetical protein